MSEGGSEPAPPEPHDPHGGRPLADRFREPGDDDPSSLWVLLGVGGLCALLDVVAGALNGRGTTFLSVVLAPVLAGGSAALLFSGVHRLRRKRYLAAGANLLVLAFLLGWLGSGTFARTMMFPGANMALLELPAAGTELGDGAKVVAYTTEDGVQLKGVFVKGAGPLPRPALVYFHGNAETAALNQSWAYRLAKAGFDVFVGEFRGYGGCPGSPSQAGLRLDGLAALATLERERQTKGGKLVIMARSLGTGLGSLLAGEGHGDAVVLFSPFRSVRAMGERFASRPLVWLALRDPFDSRAALQKTQAPVLIYHGTQDRVVPYAEGKALAESLGERATLRTLKGVGHNDIVAVAGDEAAKAAAALVR